MKPGIGQSLMMILKYGALTKTTLCKKYVHY